ncbi:hypothetical protein BKA69DRAFT_1170674 [Paraphysoderma sedebokerense]|nr:hypothetical protein BKA69DRAFT_1170674 [Paraphysoderma sedebokerense]
MSLSSSLHLNLSKKGAVWDRSSRKIPPPPNLNSTWDGHFLRIINANAANQPHLAKPVAFTCTAFSSNHAQFSGTDSKPILPATKLSPSLLAAVDQRGHVWIFDLVHNRFNLMARIGISGTCLAFGANQKREVLIGLADCSFQCYNIDTGQLVAKLPSHHTQNPTTISTHPSLPLALSTSQSEVILWDTNKWTRKRVLTGAQSVGVRQASFTPDGSKIISSFLDNSLLIWSTESLELVWKTKLPITTEATTVATDSSEIEETTKTNSNVFAISRNGDYLVVGTNHASILVYAINEKSLVHEIQIPYFKSRSISQIQFVGSTNTVAVLSDAGKILFIDSVQGSLMFKFESRYLVKSLNISPDGMELAIISQTNTSILVLYDLAWLIEKSKLVLEMPSFLPEDSGYNTGPQKPSSPERTSLGDRSTSPQRPKSPTKVHPSPDKTKQSPTKEMKPIQTEAPGTSVPTLFDTIMLTEHHKNLNGDKLRSYLRHYGEYPAKYRTLIYRYLLKLPENRDAFEALVAKGTHPSLRDFRTKFPMKTAKMGLSMERILSALVYWCPLFEDLEYLPAMVFPFIKVFENDSFACFECMMTIVLNWCQKWWEYYPNPPIDCLDIVEDLLNLHDSELLGHFVKYKVTSQIYAWIPFKSLFSDMLSKSDWLRVWDHCISNDPEFMYYFLIAFLMHFRVPLMNLVRIDDFKLFFQRINAVSLSPIISLAYRLVESTSPKIAPSSVLHPFQPISKPQYPAFNEYPTYLVAYQTKLLERIRKEEEEYLRKRKVVDDVNKLQELLKKDKEMWENGDWKMNDMLEKWWDKILGAETSHLERKQKVSTESKLDRTTAAFTIARARENFINQHINSTTHRNNIMSQAATTAIHLREKNSELENWDKEFEGIEKEWGKRWDELRKVKIQLGKVEKLRTERLVKLVGEVGVAKDQDDWNENEKENGGV